MSPVFCVNCDVGVMAAFDVFSEFWRNTDIVAVPDFFDLALEI